MKENKVLIAVILFFLNSTIVKSEPLAILPFVKGTLSSIKDEYKQRPFILIFWSESCGYCMKELAMFGKLQKQFPHISLVTVATDSFLEDDIIRRVINESQLTLSNAWVFSDRFPENIYADVNKRWRGELPVTHFFDAHHNENRVLGIINEEALIEWLAL